MCFSKPKIPTNPPAPPPMQPTAEPVLGKDTDEVAKMNARKKIGTARLQVPLTKNTQSGLGIPKV